MARRSIMFAPIALAFADASIVVLALPQIVALLHTSISHVAYVIVVYNAALIIGALAVRLLAPGGERDRALLITGLLVFGLASLGAGLSPSEHWLLLFRAVQGLGGGVLLCASLPQLAVTRRPGESTLAAWASAAAIGAALGPAVGGLLTQLFDWRAIFLAQAPVAGASAASIWLLHRSAAVAPASAGGSAAATPASAASDAAGRTGASTASPSAAVSPILANIALALLSAGVIGALFMITLLLINVWGFTPVAAAAMLTLLPVMTALTDRLTRRLSITQRATGGALALGVGLLALSVASHREPVLAVLALVLSGSGLGASFPALTAAAMDGGHDSEMRRVSLTVAARDAGLVIGLLVLTPVFVSQLNAVTRQALHPVTRVLLAAPEPGALKLALGLRLLHAEQSSPASELPNLGPAFRTTEASATPAQRPALERLQPTVKTLIVDEATRAFRPPLIGGAIFALLVLPVLLLRRLLTRPRPPLGTVPLDAT